MYFKTRIPFIYVRKPYISCGDLTGEFINYPDVEMKRVLVLYCPISQYDICCVWWYFNLLHGKIKIPRFRKNYTRILNRKLFQLKYHIIYPYCLKLEYPVKKNTKNDYLTQYVEVCCRVHKLIFFFFVLVSLTMKFVNNQLQK